MFRLGGVLCLDLEAVIKSAARAASRQTKSRNKIQGSARTTARRADGGRPGGFPGSWFPGFGLTGGCASSRLDYGLNFTSSGEAALAADLFTNSVYH